MWMCLSIYCGLRVAFSVRSWSTGVTVCQRIGADSLFGKCCSMAWFTSMPMVLLWAVITFGEIWMVYFFALLHRHELLWYGGALAETLKNDNHSFDPIPILDDVETLVTGRLRHASMTWVRRAIIAMIIMAILVAIMVSYLISSPALSPNNLMKVLLGCLF